METQIFHQTRILSLKNPLTETKILHDIIYLYNILGGRPFHPSVSSSIHPTCSSRKNKMMEEEEEDESDSSKLKISN
jgi:hypothetical protein